VLSLGVFVGKRHILFDGHGRRNVSEGQASDKRTATSEPHRQLVGHKREPSIEIRYGLSLAFPIQQPIWLSPASKFPRGHVFHATVPGIRHIGNGGLCPYLRLSICCIIDT